MPKRTLPQPRSWATPDTRHHFGRNQNLLWRNNITARDRPFANAARAQHAFLTHIHEAARAAGQTSRDLAARLDISVDQYRRLRRGETHLTLADMHQLAAHLGIPIDTRVRPSASER